MATEKLLTSENVARRGTLPPSIPVITGAAVAVGQNMHIKPACASVSPSGCNRRYMIIPPMICTDRSIHESLVILNSAGFTLQYVISSIMKIR